MIRRLFILNFFLHAYLACGQAPFSHHTPQNIYAESRELFDRAMYSPAAEGFQNVIRKVDSETDLAEQSSFFYVLCGIKLMNRDAGDQVLKFLNEYPTSARRKELILGIAEYSFNRRRYRDAKIWLNRLNGMYLPKKEKAELQFKLGYSLFMLKDFENARAQFSAAKSSEFNISASAQYYYGHIAYLDTNDVTALENLEPLIDHPSFGFVVPYYLAQIYSRRLMDDKLLALGESLFKKSSIKRLPEISKLIGQSLLRKKRYDEALPYLLMHRDRGGVMKASDYYELGFLLSKNQRFKEAIQSLNKITSTKSVVSEYALYLLANCYVKEDQNEKALSAFRAVSEIANDEVIREESSYQTAKLTYESSSPFGNAISEFQQFLVDFPETEYRREVNEYLANLYITSKDYTRAMSAIIQTGMSSMAMREAYQRVAYYRAVEFYHISSWKKAKEFFTKSLTYPQNLTYVALAHFWMGELAYKKNDPQEALARFESFLKTPGSYTLSERPVSLYNKAYCLYRLNRLDDAAAAFRVFIQDAEEENKRKNDATLRLADLYFLMGKYSLAEEYYKTFTAATTQFNYSHASYAEYQRSLCLGLLNRYKEKIGILKTLSERETRSDAFGGKYSVEALYELGKTQLAIGNNSDAEISFVEYVRKNPNLEKARRALLNQALAQRNDGRFEISILTFKRVVQLYPGTPESREAIGISRSVFDDANRLDDYIEWVDGIDFASIRASELDSVAFMSGVDKYAQSNFPAALISFQNYNKRFPDGFFAEGSNYYAAECFRKEGDFENAKKMYKNVVQFSANEFTVKSWVWILRIASQEKFYDVEEIEYAAQALLNISNDAQFLREANTALMRTYQSKGDVEVAQAYSKVVASDDRNSPELREEANLNLVRNNFGFWLQQKKSLDNDSIAWKKMDNLKLKTIKICDLIKDNGSASAQAETSYYISCFLNFEKNYLGSNEEIFWLIDNLPGQAKWRYKALLILSKNYAGLEDDFQAIYTLDFIISENYSEDLTNDALKLKNEIEASKQKEPIELDSTATRKEV